MNKKSSLATAVLLAILATNGMADTPAENTPRDQSEPVLDEFYKDSEKGWFWYETHPEEQKEKPKKRQPNQPTVIPTSKKQIKRSEVKPEDQPLSQAWFRKNFAKYRDNAIENPHDKKAMRTYLYLEKFMRDRSQAFGYARQSAVYSEPFLDATANRATANFGMKDMNIDANEKQTTLLTDLGKKTGIYFFFRSDCPYCKKQMPIIKLLEKKYGFTIRPVSLDGNPLPDSLWDDYLVNVDQAQQLGVKKVPALYLFEPKSNTTSLISQGLQSMPQLEKRVLYSANRSDLITDDELKLTRPSGLYQDINGEVGSQIIAPTDAPEEFKNLFTESLKFKEEGQ